eukprot:scaffold576629_cov31-Prasinocladus_malaysianus.AAC.1
MLNRINVSTIKTFQQTHPAKLNNRCASDNIYRVKALVIPIHEAFQSSNENAASRGRQKKLYL